jgi:hypothetical protein
VAASGAAAWPGFYAVYVETLAFLFTGIEGSTALLGRLGDDDYAQLPRHRARAERASGPRPADPHPRPRRLLSLNAAPVVPVPISARADPSIGAEGLLLAQGDVRDVDGDRGPALLQAFLICSARAGPELFR